MNEAAIAKLELIHEDMKSRVVQLDRIYNSCTNRLVQDQLSAVIGAFCAAANELQMCIRCARDPETQTFKDANGISYIGGMFDNDGPKGAA